MHVGMLAFGYNANGQIGDGTTRDSEYVKLISTKQYLKVTCSANHTVVIDSDGAMFACGWNGQGALGDETYTSQNAFVPSAAGAWQEVSAGSVQSGLSYTLAIKSDGTMWAWGSNGNGQLGQGVLMLPNGLAYISSPLQVGTSSDWWSLATAPGEAFAINTSGHLYNWGYTDAVGVSLTPTRVGLAKWNAVASGRNHTLGIQSDGSLWAWGENGYRQLGDGTGTYQATPVQVDAGSWLSVSCGNRFSFGIKSDGTLWSWGLNVALGYDPGQVGYVATPTQVGVDSWLAVECGDNYAIGLKDDGTLWSWGANTYGGLGLNNTASYITPQKVSTFAFSQIAVGAYHSFALT